MNKVDNVLEDRGMLTNQASIGVGHEAKLGRVVSKCLCSSDVIERLEEAGSTLLALPSSGYSTRLRASPLEFVQEARNAYASDIRRMRPAVPSAAQITQMDEAFGWLRLVPQSRYVLRRIVGARSLVSPMTARHLFSWRKLAAVLGADHKAVQRWHAEGINLIVDAMRNVEILAP